MRQVAASLLTALLLAAAPSVQSEEQPAEEQPAEEQPADVRLAGLDLGTWWYGAKVGIEPMEGKVVLFVMWGSTTGSKQITPHLIALSQRMQGKAFHLIASHCEEISSEGEVVAFLRANHLAPTTPNMTVVKEGRHPGIVSPGPLPKYPYYAVFDHAGRLVQKGLGATYFGGDGLAMFDWVDKTMAAAPAVWVGEEPYAQVADLAAKIAAGKGLAAHAKRLETQQAAATDAVLKAELDRLHEAVRRHRDRAIKGALALEGSQPSEVLPALKDLVGDFKGTTLGAEVDQAQAQTADSADLKVAVALEKKFRSIAAAFEKVKQDKRTDVLIDKTDEKLKALIAGHESLPFAATVEHYRATLRTGDR